MNDNWVNIFSTQSNIEAEIVKFKLEDEGITSVLLNKQDSSYLNFGSIFLYVAPEDVVKAKHIIATNSEKENE